MQPDAFVAEVYRRMRGGGSASAPRNWQQISRDPTTRQAVENYRRILPQRRDAEILDIGFGEGWFIAACIELGYIRVSGAEFGASDRRHVADWPSAVVGLLDIESSIGDLLGTMPNRYDFIHLSHVIEHVPKHGLLYAVDGLYLALRPGGTLCLRTPNMEGPCALSSLYVTLGHEYGFTGSNLTSLLTICGFEDVRFHGFSQAKPTLRQWVGRVVRAPFMIVNRVKHRLFGVNVGGQFGPEIIVTAKRGNRAPLFDERFR